MERREQILLCLMEEGSGDMGRFSNAPACHMNSVYYYFNGKGFQLMQSLIELPHACFSPVVLIQVILALKGLVWCFKGWRILVVAVRIGDFQHSSPALWYR